jgi:hypothetical protein
LLLFTAQTVARAIEETGVFLSEINCFFYSTNSKS